MELLPLKGPKSLRVLNACHSLLLGLKMLPAYMDQDYKEFYAAFEDMPEEIKETKLREAMAFVRLEDEEIAACVSFARDANGVPYNDANIKNLTPDALFEIVIAVCMEISRFKIDLVSKAEKKN